MAAALSGWVCQADVTRAYQPARIPAEPTALRAPSGCHQGFGRGWRRVPKRARAKPIRVVLVSNGRPGAEEQIVRAMREALRIVARIDAEAEAAALAGDAPDPGAASHEIAEETDVF